MKVGLQLFSVKTYLQSDTRGTVRRIAELGVKYLESFQYFTPGIEMNYGFLMPGSEAKKLLDDAGVTLIGGHFADGILDDDAALRDFFRHQADAGSPAVGLASDYFASADECRKKAERYNAVGALAAEYGLKFFIHNHYNEFQRFEGKTALDWILDGTDPKLVAFELDTYWAMRGGADPLKLIHTHRERLIRLHQKDLSAAAKDRINLFDGIVAPDAKLDGRTTFAPSRPEDFAEIGTGIMDIQAIIDKGNEAGIPYLVLEQDQTALDEFESVALSVKNLKNYRGIEQA